MATIAVAGASPIDRARTALETASADPRRAQTDAVALLAGEGGDGGDPCVASVCERVLGVAALALGDSTSAIDHLHRAIGLAEGVGDAVGAAGARTSLCTALGNAGQPLEALQQADLAAPALAGVDRAAVEMQRAAILHRLGRLDDALAGYQRALPVFRRAGDVLREARLLNNRALYHVDTGALPRAERDLRRSHRLFLSLGQRRSAAGAVRNLGYVASRTGDVPAALAHFDASEAEFRELGLPIAFPSDRCELLLSARLVAEARDCAEAAVQALEEGRMGTDLAEARLMVAEAGRRQGDLVAARAAAELALAAFEAQGRPAWSDLARYALVRIAWADGDRSPATWEQARRVADRLAAHGWATSALDARVTAARIALESGRPDAAADDLELARRARRSGPVRLRAQAWHAEALLRLSSGDERGALGAAQSGLRVIDLHRATLGATELRVHASGHGEELSALGLGLVLRGGGAAQVLRWAERCRAGALTLPPVRPPQDSTLRAELAELRAVHAEIDTAALAGRDTSRLVARQARAERSILQRSRHLAGAEGTRLGPPGVGALTAALEGRALVEVIEDGGQLHAVIVARGPCRLRSLGASAEVAGELSSLRFGLRRIAFGHGSEASRATTIANVHHAAGRLDELLLAPLADDIGERELVLVPTASLHALPWALLPSCRDRAFTVAPSATLWWRAATQRRRARGTVVLVAGPKLAGAATEVAALAAVHPEASVLTGAGATVGAVTAAMERATLLHVAAHGRFRADNPLFSAIELHDGPLTVFDLESLRSAPEHIVLAACDSGVPSAHPGDELMGLSAALLALGTRTLIACVIEVPDAATSSLMVAFHEAVRCGAAPAIALARARAAVDTTDPMNLATIAGFGCFGGS